MDESWVPVEDCGAVSGVLRAMLLLLLLLVALPLAGQTRPQRPHRTGLWGELAAGGGFLRVACSTCADVNVESGGGGLVRLGGTLTDRVLVAWESAWFGDETFGFAAGDSSVVARLQTLTVMLAWFPWRSGAFLKGGVGMALGQFTVPNGAGQTDTPKGTGIGMTLGVGWDVPISRKFALTANAAAFITAIGDLVLPNSRVDDVIGTMYQMSVGVTWR